MRANKHEVEDNKKVFTSGDLLKKGKERSTIGITGDLQIKWKRDRSRPKNVFLHVF